MSGLRSLIQDLIGYSVERVVSRSLSTDARSQWFEPGIADHFPSVDSSSLLLVPYRLDTVQIMAAP